MISSQAINLNELSWYITGRAAETKGRQRDTGAYIRPLGSATLSHACHAKANGAYIRPLGSAHCPTPATQKPPADSRPVVWLATWLADSRPGWLTRDLVGWLATGCLTRDLVVWRAGCLTRGLVVWLVTWLSDSRPGCLTRATLVGWLAPSGWLTRAFRLADSSLPVGWLKPPCWLTRSSHVFALFSGLVRALFWKYWVEM